MVKVIDWYIIYYISYKFQIILRDDVVGGSRKKFGIRAWMGSGMRFGATFLLVCLVVFLPQVLMSVNFTKRPYSLIACLHFSGFKIFIVGWILL